MVDLLVGPGTLYTHVEGTAKPAIASDPVAGGWILLGEIEDDGVQVNREQTIEEHFVDAETGPVDATRTRDRKIITASLAEATVINLGRVLNDLSPTVSGGADVLADYRGNAVAKVALLFRAAKPGVPAKTRQYHVPRGFHNGNVSMVHTKGPHGVLLVEFVALVDPSAATDAEKFGSVDDEI